MYLETERQQRKYRQEGKKEKKKKKKKDNGQVGKKAQAPKQKRNRERSKGTERQLITIGGDRAVCPGFSVAQSAAYTLQRLGPSLFIFSHCQKQHFSSRLPHSRFPNEKLMSFL